MKVKEWLQHGRNLNLEVQELKIAKEKAYAVAVNATSKTNPDKVQTANGNSAENKMLKYTQYSAELDERIEELQKYRVSMLKLIAAISNPIYRIVLLDRYINCFSWEDISFKLGKTIRHTYRIHGQALVKAQEHYKKASPK